MAGGSLREGLVGDLVAAVVDDSVDLLAVDGELQRGSHLVVVERGPILAQLDHGVVE